MIKNFIAAGYEDDPGFKQGDIFENNDPHYGGIHSPDFDMCMPLFHDGKLIAWASCVSHVADAGSVTPGSIGFLNPDCYSDGIAISMERVGENDRFYPWYEKRIRSRTRTPDFVMGDARGRLAGCITIRERLDDVIEKYGLDFFLDAGQEYVEDSRRYAVGRVKSQTVPGRIRKSQFKDLAMKGKRVLLAKQDIDCMLFNLPMELTINADASVSLSLRGRQRHGALRREHQPDGAQVRPDDGLLAHRRLRHVQLGADLGLGHRDAARRLLGQPLRGRTSRRPRAWRGLPR